MHPHAAGISRGPLAREFANDNHPSQSDMIPICRGLLEYLQLTPSGGLAAGLQPASSPYDNCPMRGGTIAWRNALIRLPQHSTTHQAPPSAHGAPRRRERPRGSGVSARAGHGLAGEKCGIAAHCDDNRRSAPPFPRREGGRGLGPSSQLPIRQHCHERHHHQHQPVLPAQRTLVQQRRPPRHAIAPRLQRRRQPLRPSQRPL